MRKRWLFIPLVVGLLALVATSGAILAQGSGHPGVSHNGVVSRVAEILDLEEAALQSAINQAVREHQDEHLQALLERLVGAERLTQEEADAIMQWFQARPDAALHLKGALMMGEEAVQHRVDRMVQAGAITEEEAGAVMGWYQDRPDSLPARGLGRGRPDHQFRQGLGRGDNRMSETRAFRGAPSSFTSSVTAPSIFY